MKIVSLLESKLVDVEKDVLNQGSYDFATVYLNPVTYLYFRKNPDLLASIDGIRIDGILMRRLVSSLLLGGGEIKRQSFDMTSLAPLVFDYCVNHKLSIFITGGTENDIRAFRQKLEAHFPQLKIAGHCHGYLPDTEIVSNVVASQADVVLLGLGNIRQERVLVALRPKLRALYFTCGAFVTQTANSSGVDYYPAFIDKYDLRCTGQLNPDTFLNNNSWLTGDLPPLAECSRSRL